jgi:hypothetical protein
MKGKHEQWLLFTGECKGKEEGIKRKEHLEVNYRRGEGPMRAVVLMKKKMKMKNKNKTSFWISGFSVFCKMEMAVCNCDIKRMLYCRNICARVL